MQSKNYSPSTSDRIPKYSGKVKQSGIDGSVGKDGFEQKPALSGRTFSGLLYGQGDPLFLFIHTENNNFYVFTDRKRFARMF